MFEVHTCKCVNRSEVFIKQDENLNVIKQKIKYTSDKMWDSNSFQRAERIIKLHTDTFSMKVKKNMFQLFIVPVVIKNKTYQFVLDTGAQISGIMDLHKDLLSICKKRGQMGIKSASGTQKNMDVICMKKMFLGSIEIANQSMVVLNGHDFKLPFMKKSLVGFDGIIGWDILSQIDFEIDDLYGRFSLLKNEENFSYQNMINAAFPIVIVESQNRQTSLFGIDSGAQIGWLNKDYCVKSNLSVYKEINGRTMGVHGIEKKEVQMVKEASFSFYKSRIFLGNVRTGETKVLEDIALDGIFGNEIFVGKRIQFLNSKGIVRIL